MIMMKMIPTPSEIENRIQTMKKLETSISENKVQLTTCDGRKCVRVDKKEWDKGKVYENENNKEEIYLILDGH